jgi:hypothetical protein
MPIIIKGDRKRDMNDVWELKRKRMIRDGKRTRYHINRKDRKPEEYQGIQLFVNGKEMILSESSKFLLEQLIKDENIE